MIEEQKLMKKSALAAKKMVNFLESDLNLSEQISALLILSTHVIYKTNDVRHNKYNLIFLIEQFINPPTSNDQLISNESESLIRSDYISFLIKDLFPEGLNDSK